MRACVRVRNQSRDAHIGVVSAQWRSVSVRVNTDGAAETTEDRKA